LIPYEFGAEKSSIVAWIRGDLEDHGSLRSRHNAV